MLSDNKKDRIKCLDDLQVVRFVHQKCSDTEHQEIETHITQCKRCFKEVAALIKAQSVIMDETNWGIAPDLTKEKEKAIERYQGISGNDILRIVVQFIQRQLSKLAVPPAPLYKLRLMSHTGILYQPVRVLGSIKDSPDTPATDFNALPTFFKIFKTYRVEVTLAGNNQKMVNLRVEVKKIRERTYLPRVSFTLVDERESKVLKELTCDGSITFNDLSPSQYSVKIVKDEILIGIITLDLMKS